MARNNINNGSILFLLVTKIIDQILLCILLSKNVGEHFESWSTGILGPVALHGLDHGKWDLSGQKWTYQVHSLTLNNYVGSLFQEENLTKICFKTGWVERRSHGSCLSKWYL